MHSIRRSVLSMSWIILLDLIIAQDLQYGSLEDKTWTPLGKDDQNQRKYMSDFVSVNLSVLKANNLLETAIHNQLTRQPLDIKTSGQSDTNLGDTSRSDGETKNLSDIVINEKFNISEDMLISLIDHLLDSDENVSISDPKWPEATSRDLAQNSPASLMANQILARKTLDGLDFEAADEMYRITDEVNSEPLDNIKRIDMHESMIRLNDIIDEIFSDESTDGFHVLSMDDLFEDAWLEHDMPNDSVIAAPADDSDLTSGDIYQYTPDDIDMASIDDLIEAVSGDHNQFRLEDGIHVLTSDGIHLASLDGVNVGTIDDVINMASHDESMYGKAMLTSDTHDGNDRNYILGEMNNSSVLNKAWPESIKRLIHSEDDTFDQIKFSDRNYNVDKQKWRKESSVHPIKNDVWFTGNSVGLKDLSNNEQRSKEQMKQLHFPPLNNQLPYLKPDEIKPNVNQIIHAPKLTYADANLLKIPNRYFYTDLEMIPLRLEPVQDVSNTDYTNSNGFLFFSTIDDKNGLFQTSTPEDLKEIKSWLASKSSKEWENIADKVNQFIQLYKKQFSDKSSQNMLNTIPDNQVIQAKSGIAFPQYATDSAERFLDETIKKNKFFTDLYKLGKLRGGITNNNSTLNLNRNIPQLKNVQPVQQTFLKRIARSVDKIPKNNLPAQQSLFRRVRSKEWPQSEFSSMNQKLRNKKLFMTQQYQMQKHEKSQESRHLSAAANKKLNQVLPWGISVQSEAQDLYVPERTEELTLSQGQEGDKPLLDNGKQSLKLQNVSHLVTGNQSKLAIRKIDQIKKPNESSQIDASRLLATSNLTFNETNPISAQSNENLTLKKPNITSKLLNSTDENITHSKIKRNILEDLPNDKKTNHTTKANTTNTADQNVLNEINRNNDTTYATLEVLTQLNKINETINNVTTKDTNDKKTDVNARNVNNDETNISGTNTSVQFNKNVTQSVDDEKGDRRFKRDITFDTHDEENYKMGPVPSWIIPVSPQLLSVKSHDFTDRLTQPKSTTQTTKLSNVQKDVRVNYATPTRPNPPKTKYVTIQKQQEYPITKQVVVQPFLTTKQPMTVFATEYQRFQPMTNTVSRSPDRQTYQTEAYIDRYLREKGKKENYIRKRDSPKSSNDYSTLQKTENLNINRAIYSSQATETETKERQVPAGIRNEYQPRKDSDQQADLYLHSRDLTGQKGQSSNTNQARDRSNNLMSSYVVPPQNTGSQMSQQGVKSVMNNGQSMDQVNARDEMVSGPEPVVVHYQPVITYYTPPIHYSQIPEYLDFMSRLSPGGSSDQWSASLDDLSTDQLMSSDDESSSDQQMSRSDESSTSKQKSTMKEFRSEEKDSSADEHNVEQTIARSDDSNTDQRMSSIDDSSTDQQMSSADDYNSQSISIMDNSKTKYQMSPMDEYNTGGQMSTTDNSQRHQWDNSNKNHMMYENVQNNNWEKDVGRGKDNSVNTNKKFNQNNNNFQKQNQFFNGNRKYAQPNKVQNQYNADRKHYFSSPNNRNMNIQKTYNPGVMGQYNRQNFDVQIANEEHDMDEEAVLQFIYAKKKMNTENSGMAPSMGQDDSSSSNYYQVMDSSNDRGTQTKEDKMLEDIVEHFIYTRPKYSKNSKSG